MVRKLPRIWLTALVIGLAVLIPGALGVREAAAHDAVVITLKSISTPDPSDPLTKVYTITATFADEGDPVENARLELTAKREGLAGEVGPTAFAPTGTPGEYRAQVAFPTYGTWQVQAKVVEGASGEAVFRQEILPLGGAAAGAPVVRLVFGFQVRDVLNILVRAVHLASGALWIVATGAVLVFALLSEPERRRRLSSMRIIYPAIAGGLLGVSILTGIYNAVYNVPTVSPGIFDPGTIRGLPFGMDYLVTFFVKMGLLAGGIAGTAYVAVALWRYVRVPVPAVAGAALENGSRRGPEGRIAIAAAVALSLGILIMLDVVVLNYLHSLTHLGAFATSRGS